MRSVMLTTGVLCGVVSWVAARSCAADAWSIYTVDGGSIGPRSSLALDPSSGYPRISYCWDDWPNDHLNYAAWNGSDWDIQTVDSTGDVGGWSSLALDARGYAHISYRDYTNDDLKYAAWTGSSWDIQTVDSAEDVGRDTSLALDASGYPRISYYATIGFLPGDLKYAAWNGTSWDIQTVDSAGSVGWWSSLTLDASGYPRISYYDNTNDDLKYAAWNGTSWDIQTVDSAGDVGYCTSLALDASGHPRISYSDYTNGDLKYAAWNGSSWDIETVASAGDVGWYTSLALDATGYPHVSYYDLTDRDLEYAAWTGSTWDTQTVDSAGDVGGYTSLALDASSGYAHISYYGNGDLKYATTRPAEASHELPTTGYYMISYPLTPTSAMVHDLLCDDLGHVAGSYYLWRWNADAQAYESATSPPDACLTTPLNVNEGVWLLAQATTIDAEGALPSGRQTIALKTGWNMVRAPYAVIMDSLLVDNAGDVRMLWLAGLANWVLATFYYSHDGTGSYSTLTVNHTPPDTLSLWYGYWVLAGLPCSLIIPPRSGPPPPPMATPAGRRDTVQFAWAFDIQGSSASSGDSITVAAADGASDDFDGFALDKPKPPAAPGEGRVRMVLRQGWRGTEPPPYNKAPGSQMPWSSELAMQTKGTADDAAEWEFTVSGGGEGESVRLSWPELSRLPKERVAILKDRDTGRQTFMRTRAQYEFSAPGEGSSRSFAVTVKRPQQGAALISSLSVVPLRGAGGAEIAFSLSADASVNISVTNIAGRVVQRIRKGVSIEAGMHTIMSDGRSLSGTALPNGVYLCVLEAKTADGQRARRVCPVSVRR